MAPNDIDETTAAALREVGLPVSEGMTDKEAMRTYILTAQSVMRREAKAKERELKGFYVDFLFDRLNVTRFR